MYGRVDSTALEDYADDIDEYPEYGDQVNVNGAGDPLYRGSETRALRCQGVQRLLKHPKMQLVMSRLSFRGNNHLPRHTMCLTTQSKGNSIGLQLAMWMVLIREDLRILVRRVGPTLQEISRCNPFTPRPIDMSKGITYLNMVFTHLTTG